MTAGFTWYVELGSRGSRGVVVLVEPGVGDEPTNEVALLGSETKSASSTITGLSTVPVPRRELVYLSMWLTL